VSFDSPQRPPLMPISVRIPDACRLTGLSRSRLYELMKSGDVEFVKVGSSTLVIVESLRRFIDAMAARQDGRYGRSRTMPDPSR